LAIKPTITDTYLALSSSALMDTTKQSTIPTLDYISAIFIK